MTSTAKKSLKRVDGEWHVRGPRMMLASNKKQSRPSNPVCSAVMTRRHDVDDRSGTRYQASCVSRTFVRFCFCQWELFGLTDFGFERSNLTAMWRTHDPARKVNDHNDHNDPSRFMLNGPYLPYHGLVPWSLILLPCLSADDLISLDPR